MSSTWQAGVTNQALPKQLTVTRGPSVQKAGTLLPSYEGREAYLKTSMHPLNPQNRTTSFWPTGKSPTFVQGNFPSFLWKLQNYQRPPKLLFATNGRPLKQYKRAQLVTLQKIVIAKYRVCGLLPLPPSLAFKLQQNLALG